MTVVRVRVIEIWHDIPQPLLPLTGPEFRNYYSIRPKKKIGDLPQPKGTPQRRKKRGDMVLPGAVQVLPQAYVERLRAPHRSGTEGGARGRPLPELEQQGTLPGEVRQEGGRRRTGLRRRWAQGRLGVCVCAYIYIYICMGNAASTTYGITIECMHGMGMRTSREGRGSERWRCNILIS